MNRTHDFDETLAFMGGDPEHPMELNGEVELFIEDEHLPPQVAEAQARL